MQKINTPATTRNMSKNNQDNWGRKIFLTSISAASCRFFRNLQSLVQPSMVLGQLGEQTKEKIGGAIGQVVGGNQTGNQTGGVLGQLGEKVKSMLPGQ